MERTTVEGLLATIEAEAEPAFTARQNALSFIDSALNESAWQVGPNIDGLRQRATEQRTRLTALDEALFEQMRSKIQKRQYTPQSFRAELEQATGYVRWNPQETKHTFDSLDTLFDGILGLDDKAFIYQTTAEPEMVFYNPTPARIILLLADYAGLEPEDVVYDLGSGTGRVPLLLHLVTGLKTCGVEYDGVLHGLASRSQALLNLAGVSFWQGDARTADYTTGTVFYMFTPFQGQLFQAVLDRLQAEARQRSIRVIAYGGCIPTVRDQAWLRETTPDPLEAYRTAIFQSQINR